MQQLGCPCLPFQFSSCHIELRAPSHTPLGLHHLPITLPLLRCPWCAASNASQPQGGDTFELVCRPFSDVVADLTAPGGTCTLAAAGITISSEREDRGIKFSFPTYHSSLAIMVYAEEKQDTGWFFLRPFDWTGGRAVEGRRGGQARRSGSPPAHSSCLTLRQWPLQCGWPSL